MKKIALVTWILCVFAFSLNFHLGVTSARAESDPGVMPCDEWYTLEYDWCGKNCSTGEWPCCTAPDGSTGWRHYTGGLGNCTPNKPWLCYCTPPTPTACNPCSCPLYCEHNP